MTGYELSVKLRQLKGVTAEAARRAAPRIKAQILSNVNRQVDTNGKPWEPRSDKTRLTGPMLTGAGQAVEVVVRGSAIVLALAWEIYGRHSRGAINNHLTRGEGAERSHKKHAKKRLISREVIPNNPNFLPPKFAEIIRQEINAVMSESLGQKVEAA